MPAPSESLTVRVALGERSYDIVIVSRRLAEFAAALSSWMVAHGRKVTVGQSAFLVTDKNVREPHAVAIERSLSAAGWKCATVVLEPGEQTKSLADASQLYDRLVALPADRNTVVVAVGGGVVGDLAGFVAATYARGIPFVQVPTTLLAQVDSSVGGKVGVNHPQGKNLIGAFYQPLGVYIDTELLNTLPVRDYRAGLAEVIKYGVILDAAFFEFLERHISEINVRDAETLRHIVARCCRLKADVVEQDEFEQTGARAALNYGHTFAHAFEALCGYGELLHGEAVSIGMMYAARLAERLGRVDPSLATRQTALLEAVGLPTRLPAMSQLVVDDIIDRMRLDKKSVAGRLRFVLPSRLGHVDLVPDVPEDVVRAIAVGP